MTAIYCTMLKKASLDEILTEASGNGIEKIVTISVSPDNFQTVNDLTLKHKIVYGTQGVHPHDAKEFSDPLLDQFKENLETY